MTTRAEAAALDARCPLAGFRDRFAIPDDGLVYLNGNSLGRLPLATAARLRRVVEDERAAGLVRSWAWDCSHAVGSGGWRGRLPAWPVLPTSVPGRR